MSTLASDYSAGWEDVTETGTVGFQHDRIASEPADLAVEDWERCIDALRDLLRKVRLSEGGSQALPTSETVVAAMKWLGVLRDRYPKAPPVLINFEPGGGLIIEWQSREHGRKAITELTLYNDRSAESTVYRDNRIVYMEKVPFSPLG